MRYMKEALQSALCGWLALLLVHVLAGWTDIGLGFGWLTCGAASTLGLPGIIGLMIVNTIL